MMDDEDPAILKRIRCVSVCVCQICLLISLVHLFAASLFVFQMSVYDLIYMNMVTMIVMCVSVFAASK